MAELHNGENATMLGNGGKEIYEYAYNVPKKSLVGDGNSPYQILWSSVTILADDTRFRYN